MAEVRIRFLQLRRYHISPCGAAGYKRFCDALLTVLREENEEELVEDVIADPGITGNFEVSVAGKLVHSKKTMGHGRAESVEEVG